MTDKVEAIFHLIREGASQKCTQAGVNRAARAAKILGLSDSERLALLTRLDICDRDGKPYRSDIKRTW